MSTESLMWLLPILWMLHNIEELLLFKRWLLKNRELIAGRFPRAGRLILPVLDAVTTPILMVAVAEEFVLLSLITLITVEAGWYAVFAGFIVGHTLHVGVHIALGLKLKQYVPAVVTAALTLPYSVLVLYALATRGLIDLGGVIFWSVWASIFLVGNVILSHFLARKFDRWLRRVYA